MLSSLAVFLAASGAQSAAPAVDLPYAGVTFRPISARSLDGRLDVVVSASRGDHGRASAHALVRRPGAFVEWIELPRAAMPSAVVATDSETIHLIYGAGAVDPWVVTIDPTGATLAETSLSRLLPVAAVIAADQPMFTAEADGGTCIGVPLVCGSLAFVRFDAAAPTDPYGGCGMARPEKYVCSVNTWLERGRALVRAGDLTAAREAFEAAVETDPLDPRTYRELSRFLSGHGTPEEQLACLALAVDRLHSNASGPLSVSWRVGSPAARLTLDYVNARERRGGPGDAHAALDVALSLYPTMEDAVLKRAELLLAEGRDDEALIGLASALASIDPNRELAEAHADVGRFLVRAGRSALAVRFLEDAFALGDRSEFLLRCLADLSVESADLDRAILWLQTLARIWRDEMGGETNEERRQRGQARLMALETEIAALADRAPKGHGDAR